MIIIREYSNFSVIRQKLDFNNESHVSSPKDVIRGQKKFQSPALSDDQKSCLCLTEIPTKINIIQIYSKRAC
jgi:hypothetical protein